MDSLTRATSISRLTESLPEQRALIGIQPQRIDWGDDLSEPVAAAVPLAVQEVSELLDSWTADGA